MALNLFEKIIVLSISFFKTSFILIIYVVKIYTHVDFYAYIT